MQHQTRPLVEETVRQHMASEVLCLVSAYIPTRCLRNLVLTNHLVSRYTQRRMWRELCLDLDHGYSGLTQTLRDGHSAIRISGNNAIRQFGDDAYFDRLAGHLALVDTLVIGGNYYHGRHSFHHDQAKSPQCERDVYECDIDVLVDWILTEVVPKQCKRLRTVKIISHGLAPCGKLTIERMIDQLPRAVANIELYLTETQSCCEARCKKFSERLTKLELVVDTNITGDEGYHLPASLPSFSLVLNHRMCHKALTNLFKSSHNNLTTLSMTLHSGAIDSWSWLPRSVDRLILKGNLGMPAGTPLLPNQRLLACHVSRLEIHGDVCAELSKMTFPRLAHVAFREYQGGEPVVYAASSQFFAVNEMELDNLSPISITTIIQQTHPRNVRLAMSRQRAAWPCFQLPTQLDRLVVTAPFVTAKLVHNWYKFNPELRHLQLRCPRLYKMDGLRLVARLGADYVYDAQPEWFVDRTSENDLFWGTDLGNVRLEPLPKL